MRTILVTGGCGFIGSAVCRLLAADRSTRVVNVDKLTYAGNRDNVRELERVANYLFVEADICDQPQIEALMRRERVSGVLNLAAESHVDRSITGSAEFIRTNVNGSYSMLEAARAHWEKLPADERDSFRFVQISTDEVFGSLEMNEPAFVEDSPYHPNSPYSASKAASDHLALAWNATYGLPVILTNCSNNYGPYHFPEKLIPLVILNCLDELPLPVYGTGQNVRDWLYVEDHADALATVLASGRGGSKYNIGGNSECTNIDVVRGICTALDRLRPRNGGASYADLITFVPDRPGHDFRYAIDGSFIKAQLGWEPRQTFETGLIRTIEWYLANEWWWRPIREKRYQGERLGLLPAGDGAPHAQGSST